MEGIENAITVKSKEEWGAFRTVKVHNMRTEKTIYSPRVIAENKGLQLEAWLCVNTEANSYLSA